MNLTLLYVWLIGHFLADFYFQTNKMAHMKNTDKKVLFKHNLIYILVMLGVILPVFYWPVLWSTLFIAVSHAFIDTIAIYLKRKYKEKSIIFYIFDQILHIMITLTTFIYLQNSPFSHYIVQADYPIDILLKWILMLLIIIQPISVTIRTVLEPYRPKSDEVSGVKNAGALVGILERLIIFLLLSVGQYGAIGFVLTAKSIARYNRISEDPMFSEYYLLGTLLSMLLVIAPYLMLF